MEIDATGSRVIDEPPVRFRRAAGMKPLPTPVLGGSVEGYAPSLMSIPTRLRIGGCLGTRCVARLRPLSGPCAVRRAGSAGPPSRRSCGRCSTNTAPLRALPREDRDLFIAASDRHVLAFDNVSGLRPWTSDTLCRLATGGGFAVRQLYTDQDEVLFDAARPVILNGIEDISGTARPR